MTEKEEITPPSKTDHQLMLEFFSKYLDAEKALTPALAENTALVNALKSIFTVTKGEKIGSTTYIVHQFACNAIRHRSELTQAYQAVVEAAVAWHEGYQQIKPGHFARPSELSVALNQAVKHLQALQKGENHD